MRERAWRADYLVVTINNWVDVVLYYWLKTVFFVLCLSALSYQGLAKDSVQVVTENFYPYNYLDENAQIVGQSTELVKQVLNNADVDFSLALYPWTRAMSLASDKPNVLIYTILRTPEREPDFHWICPVAPKRLHKLFRLQQRPDVVVNSLQDIKNYSIAVTRDTFLHKFMLQLGLIEGQNLQVTADDKVNITLFLAGRVDLLAEFDDSLSRTLIADNPQQSLMTPVFSLPADAYPEYCMALSKATPLELVEKIRAAHHKFSAQ